MMLIPDGAIPLIMEGNKQVGWQMLTADFEFHAVEQEDGTVNSYVNWGDDQGADVANHENFDDARTWYDTLKRATTA